METSSSPRRPAVTILDVITLAPVETYAVLVHLTEEKDPAVTQALALAVHQVLVRTRLGEAL